MLNIEDPENLRKNQPLFPVSILTGRWHSDQHQTATKISRLEESQTLDGMGIHRTPIPQVYYFQVFFGSYGVLHHQFLYRHNDLSHHQTVWAEPDSRNLWWLFCFTMCFSMDWFKGKITGKHHIYWENLWFPVDFPLNQSIVFWVIPIEKQMKTSGKPPPSTTKAQKHRCHVKRWGTIRIAMRCQVNFQFTPASVDIPEE